MLRRSLLGLFMGLTASLWGQVDTTDAPLDDNSATQIQIENLVDDADAQEFDFDTEFENLEIYQRNPLDINKASREELQALNLLSAIQIQALINYRNRFGQIFSLYELQGVPTFDQSSIAKILPFVSLEATKEMEAFSFKRAFKYKRQQVFMRYQRNIEEQAGFLPQDGEDPDFLGSPDKLYLRYRLTYKDRLSMGLTLEKDAGEEWLTPFSQKNQTKLPDYFSAHFFIKDYNKWVKAIALGDYQVYFGQGLTSWSGFGTRKGAAVLNIKRLSNKIRPYSSVNEALFMRGGAATIGGSKWEATVFGSHRFRDGNISLVQTDSLDDSFEVLEVSSLQLSGLHRTENELEDKNSLQQITTGANMTYKANTWRIGANVVYNRLSDSLVRTPRLYQKYAFNGQSLLNASLDYNLAYRNLQFFGETAVSDNGGLATINGLTAALDEKVSMALIYRNYAKNYQTLTGNAFGESAGTNNEKGLYMGLNANLGRGLSFSGYFDLFVFPWLRSNIDAPSKGHEYFVRLDYQPAYRWNLYFQYRFEQKEGNRSDNATPYDYLINKKRQNARIHFRYRLSREWEIRSRAELSFYEDHEFSKGFMMYQDLVWSARFAPLKVQTRFAIFATEDYDTRIYAYENDVLYAFSVPAYYGRGSRFYINTSYKFNRNLTLWVRYAQTYWADRDEISSGQNLILGNTRSELKVQLRLKF
ncbi:ComEA family DNA-binding protein [Saprospira grandis]|uniref:ComEA family DNA-binding protein n=1 Tax=Saprospira grandis TaxID=1008 RepID=UPI0022DD02F3|nr:helix-hairpin-helix domain-containing protein [Saprospira grandis]WBM73696.1 helix-hairpin-helix domain-containing protein [Saprospira grandis]